jgi:hypothetical protein
MNMVTVVRIATYARRHWRLPLFVCRLEADACQERALWNQISLSALGF